MIYKILRQHDLYHNPDPLYRLVGEVNETTVLVEGQRTRALIDSGSQLSSISLAWVKKLKLNPQHIWSVLQIEGSGGLDVPYLGYVEFHLRVPEVKAFDTDVLLLIVPDSVHTMHTPTTLRTLHIHMAIKLAMKMELENLNKQWNRSLIATKLPVREAQLVNQEDVKIVSQIDGIVKITKDTTMTPFENMPPSMVPQLNENVPKKVAGNAPKGDLLESLPRENGSRLEKCLESLNLNGIESWDEQQQSVRDLLAEYQDLFAMNLSELGKMCLVQHNIKLDDTTPFKEHYRRIPPHQYEEVKKHLQEMMEIGTIHKSTSPLASPIVLAHKKDSGLQFYINLRKLNNKMIKDAQSLPRIEDSLDCLDGATIFTSLDVQSGYWQVELTEASRPLTAFTVGPSGFYECVCMLFGLTNAPATFQHLMESCIGDMHLKWCIIYLDDIIIFSKTPEEHIQ